MERENSFVSIYRKCNGLTNEEKYNQIKSGEVTVPVYIDVELTNACNFNCRMCPTGTGAMKRARGFMTDEVFDEICRNVEKYNIEGVRLIRWGEPTLHKKFIEYVKRLKALGTKVHFNTNGSLFTKEMIDELLEIEVDAIKFSFQGVDEKSYNEMRSGGDYNHLLEIIRYFYERRGNREKPHIQIATTTTYETQKQIDKFIDEIKDYCDLYTVGSTHFDYLDVDKMEIDEAERIKIKELKEYENQNKEHLMTCPEAFNKLSINWNGDVTICCSDYDNKAILGNIMEEDIKEIFLGEKVKPYRDLIAKGEYDKIPLCRICYDLTPLTK